MDQRNICNQCITDSFLQKLSEQVTGACDFCHKNGILINNTALLSSIDAVFKKFFKQTQSGPIGLEVEMAEEGLWKQPGESLIDLLGELVTDDRAVAEALQGYLSYEFGPNHQGDPIANDLYDVEAYYEYIGPDASHLHEEWDAHKTGLKERSRFFNKRALGFLDQVFLNMEKLDNENDQSVLIVYGPERNSAPIYRARSVNNQKQLTDLLTKLPSSVGPPPPAFASSGRMNAQGISVFYGALDEETCIAEIRPPVNSIVALAEFSIISELTVLDLDALLKVKRLGSLFDAHHQNQLANISFLDSLVRELKKPVIHGENEADYLITQFVSEYLAQRTPKRIDGLCFNSTQVEGEGTNIVLFHPTSRLKFDSTITNSDIRFMSDGNDEDELSRYENGFMGPRMEAIVNKENSDQSYSERLHVDDRGITLECNLHNIKILKVKGVKYNTSGSQINWINSKMILLDTD
jgi:hypothetical protein